MKDREPGVFTKRELVAMAVGGAGLLTGITVACTEAQRARSMEETIEKVVRAQILQQEIICERLLPNTNRTKQQCKDLLEREYKR